PRHGICSQASGVTFVPVFANVSLDVRVCRWITSGFKSRTAAQRCHRACIFFAQSTQMVNKAFCIFTHIEPSVDAAEPAAVYSTNPRSGAETLRQPIKPSPNFLCRLRQFAGPPLQPYGVFHSTLDRPPPYAPDLFVQATRPCPLLHARNTSRKRD